MEEFAQVSITRYNALIERKFALEARIQELERHIDEMESLLQKACDEASYSWATIEIADIKRVVEIKERQDEV